MKGGTELSQVIFLKQPGMPAVPVHHSRTSSPKICDPRIKIKKSLPFLMDVEGAAQTYVF
jgi:hypothetical protein